MEKIDFKKEFNKRQDEVISHLQGLIQIPSVAGEAEGDSPFGLPVQKALDYMLDLGKSMGFQVKNVDNYGGHIDFPGDEEGAIGIVGHVDVVPEGEGWTRRPFGGDVEDGWIYGRGAQDDKGGTIIGLYAMYLLKELGFRPRKTLRLILGLDEETNWDGIKYYLEKETPPEFGIVPDADFPLVQCEKGLLQFDLQKKNEDGFSRENDGDCILLSLEGGTAANVVAGTAQARIGGKKANLESMTEKLQERAETRRYPLKVEEKEGEVILRVTGKTAHAASPEKGRNAISMLMDLIAEESFSNSEAKELVKFYQDKIGFSTDGSKIGGALSDDLSGSLTFNVGEVLFNEEMVRLTIDIRYPVTKSKEDVFGGIEPAIREYGLEIVEKDHIGSIFLDEDDPRLGILMDTYRRISGDTESKAKVIGGATFARAIPNCVAFGPLFPGDPELEHEKDEGVKISQLFKAGEIYAEALYQLAK